MKKSLLILLAFVIGLFFNGVAQKNKTQEQAQQDSASVIQQLILAQKEQHKIDSMVRVQLQATMANASAYEKAKLEKKLEALTVKDSLKKVAQLEKIETLKKFSKSFPVVLFNDTILNIYTKTGSFNAKARAEAISERLRKLYDDDFLNLDSLELNANESSVDIVYKNDNIIMSITDIDGLWFNAPISDLSEKYLDQIKYSISKYKSENGLFNWLKRIVQILIIIACLWFLIFLINRLFKKSKNYLIQNQEHFLNGVSFKKFKIFSPQKHRQFALKINNAVRLLVIILLMYLSLPLIFSVFPETKSFTDTLLNWILSPAKNVLLGVWHFLPNLFTILVIYYITKYVLKAIHYFFSEIEKGNIKLNGFHSDWAMSTFNILRFVLYSFMVVVIFPYLPGSDSAAFQGVSVFLGILFSLGSSSAITNMIAGLVITYMRPFKIGDRVKIGEVVGDVLEKNMLVTRIRTIKNEEITVPNSAVLSNHTTNYSSNASDTGLIIHSTVTIGYDVPWKKVHAALVEAASRIEFILKEPKSFVLQTSLDDFYVSYQINAYTKDANRQAEIYSILHQNIQDCFNESGIEILSPHYRAARDGNSTTIPSDYLSKDYKAPPFNVNVTKDAQ
ncbi:mechanosensitive ion channel family protein [Aurantibacillus circumpalustris]|uniref:mechanosensitive ion channel family protein n=1 Tax=Aurantibacillus circumpalustris TaxID=3036359 RepID=UPI00295A694A|nr:mechanosensitive ion channel family protein [Aurantibacillus circumpalustris]